MRTVLCVGFATLVFSSMLNHSILMAAEGNGTTKPKVESGSLHREIKESLTYEYWIKFPAGYEKKEKWPLIMYLHGGGPKTLDHMKSLNDQFRGPFVSLVPVCPENGKEKYWSYEVLAELVKEISAKHKIDKKRVYVMGYSMGGTATWELTYRNPKLFAAIVTIAGSCSGWAALHMPKIPVWAFLGKNDKYYGIGKFSAELVNERTGKVKITTYPEMGHGIKWLTLQNPKVYEWLLQQKRLEGLDKVVVKRGTCLKTETAPVIDGNIYKEFKVWRKAPTMTGFMTPQGEEVEYQTIVKAIYDDKALYISAQAYSFQLSALIANKEKRDENIWEDDCLEVLIDANGDKKTYHHFIVNPNGVMYDAAGKEKSWNAANVQAAAGKTNDSWTMELAIPWKDLGVSAPKDKQEIRILFARMTSEGKRWIDSQWPPTGGSNHQPERFGTLRCSEGK